MHAATRLPHGTAIRIQKLQHRFGSTPVLQGLDLNIAAGTTVALLGPSGCGKSTLLKAVAGLLQPDSGSIHFNAQPVFDVGINVAPEQRQLGMVFQDYALWPHMNVYRNVCFPLRMRGVPRAEQAAQVHHALELVGLADFAQRLPAELSGGQQQRVALARAIVSRPQLLLFDEPLSNLDRELREKLADELANVLRELGTTALYVTHDPDEAHVVAHRIVRLRAGRLCDDAPHTLI